MNKKNSALLERFEKSVSGLKKIRSARLSYVDDLVVLVCDPSCPTPSRCTYFLYPKKRNDRVLRRAARQLGLLVEPSFNYNLNSKKELIFSVPIGNLYQVHFSVSPTGNFRLVPKDAGDKVWVHLNSQKHVTINLFKLFLLGRWHTSVVYEPARGFVVKMVREGPNGEEVELQGAIRPSSNGRGYEAAVYPIRNEKPLQFGQFCLYGEFGFKVEISGQWNEWLKDDFSFPQNTVWDFNSLNNTDVLLFSRILIVYPGDVSWTRVITSLFIYGGLSTLCFFQPEVGFPALAAYRLTES